MMQGGCVKSGPDIFEKVQSDAASIRHLLKPGIIYPRVHFRLRMLLDEDLPALLKEYKALKRQVHAPAEYEYGIQYYDTKDAAWYVIGEWYGYGVMDYWTAIEGRDEYIADLQIDYPETTFMLVKRRKAGRIEHA